HSPETNQPLIVREGSLARTPCGTTAQKQLESTEPALRRLMSGGLPPGIWRCTSTEISPSPPISRCIATATCASLSIDETIVSSLGTTSRSTITTAYGMTAAGG